MVNNRPSTFQAKAIFRKIIALREFWLYISDWIANIDQGTLHINLGLNDAWNIKKGYPQSLKTTREHLHACIKFDPF